MQYIFLTLIWLADAINDYLRLKICVVCEWIFLKCLLIDFFIPNLSHIYLCIPEIKPNFKFDFSCCEFKKAIL